jgi:predicted aspartyl protease
MSKLIATGLQSIYTVIPPRLFTVAVPLDPKKPKSAVSFAKSSVAFVIVAVLTPFYT